MSNIQYRLVEEVSRRYEETELFATLEDAYKEKRIREAKKDTAQLFTDQSLVYFIWRYKHFEYCGFECRREDRVEVKDGILLGYSYAITELPGGLAEEVKKYKILNGEGSVFEALSKDIYTDKALAIKAAEIERRGKMPDADEGNK